MPSSRRGIALLVALIVVLVLAGLASSALATARIALGRATESHLTLRAELARDGLRARVAARAASVPAAVWLAAPWLVAGPDTTVQLQSLGSGWYRWSAHTAERTILAELARVPPWVAPAVDSVIVLSAVAFDSLRAAWSTDLVPSVAPESLVLQGSVAPGVHRASRHVRVGAGAVVHGIIWAPVVTVEGGAHVRGLVVARDSVIVAPGSWLEADPLPAVAGWATEARVHLLGRRGLLAPP